ncbi:MAG TPA: hypothetical protein VIY54_06085, partial [Steroidobacteraceae bacterium]
PGPHRSIPIPIPKERDFYDQAARLAAQMAERALQSAGIRAIVTSRAKPLARLEEKVRKLSEIFRIRRLRNNLVHGVDAEGDGIEGASNPFQRRVMFLVGRVTDGGQDVKVRMRRADILRWAHVFNSDALDPLALC